MVQGQKCKKCKQIFSVDSIERNSSNWLRYGFKDQKSFETHNSGNKKCPVKGIVTGTTGPPSVIAPSTPDPPPLFGPYDEYVREQRPISEDTIVRMQQNTKNVLQCHLNEGGKFPWFRTTEEAAAEIMRGILTPGIHFIDVCGQPGSGKSAVIHKVIYDLLMLNGDNYKSSKAITVTSGLSDTAWYNQLMANLTLHDGTVLWDAISSIETNFCITHRQTFHKRISYLLNNLHLFANHTFIIDESHIAEEKGMTIDLEMTKWGWSIERLKEYNIKIITVSATGDVGSSVRDRSNHQIKVILKPGENYKGLKYFRDCGMITDFQPDTSLFSLVTSNYSSPRWHFVRARITKEDEDWRDTIETVCEAQGWKIYEDDSDKRHQSIYLSFSPDMSSNGEKEAHDRGERVLRIYEKPAVHSVIVIKDKYRASKRLILTPFVGIVAEKPAKTYDVAVTAQGLVVRWFGHYIILPVWEKEEPPVFICSIKAMDEYISYIDNDHTAVDEYHTRGMTCKDNGNKTEKKIPYMMETLGETLERGGTRRAEVVAPEYRVYTNYEDAKAVMRKLGYHPQQRHERDGFKLQSISDMADIRTAEYCIDNRHLALRGQNWASYFVGYTDITDNTTARYIVIIRPDTPSQDVKDAALREYPGITP